MKKLMIAAAIVCAAVCGQAATANWTVGAQALMNGSGAGGAANLFNGTAYIFDATKISQSELFNAFAANTATFDATAQTGYVASGIVANGAIDSNNSANKFGYGNQSTSDAKVYQDYFFALVDGDKMYLSATKADNPANGTDTAANVNFGNQGQGSVQLPTEGYSANGRWAQAQAVPEPTSGLLLLLGVAGMALRRRRA